MNNEAIKAYNDVILKELNKRISQILKNNNMSYDYSIDSEGYIKIIVENGDWKHDHIRLRKVMANEGYISFGRHIPDEETGEDSFSAVYIFR